MKNSLLVVLLSLILWGCKQEIRLVTNSQSDYTIILPKDASKEEIRAAEFLNYHLQKISDCELQIVQNDKLPDRNFIQIRKSDKITSADGFKMSTKDKNIIIEGGNGRGCIYAVSELLESYLGVKYYSPDYVVIPKSSSINLPEINTEDSSPNTYRNINGAFAQDQNYKDFHRLHTIEDMFTKEYYVHTFHKLLPWQEYFETHPEYYALINNQRNKDQLCLSNPEVLEIVKHELEQEMKLHPEINYWSVSQDDNFSYCHCEKCKKIIQEEGSPSGPIIRFVNEVAKAFPDKTISTLAYQYSRKAPKQTKPLDNVQVMLCTIELNRSEAIATDERSQSFLKDIEDWGKICNHIYVWDYTVDFAHSYCPFPNLHVLQPNIQLFVKNNVDEHFQQSNTATGYEFSELKSYLIAKLLWNPDIDTEEVIREFTDAYYGDAGKFIREYLKELETEITSTGEFLDIYGPPTNYKNTFLSADKIAKYTTLFDSAEKAVQDNEVQLLHVQTARMSLQYAKMEIGKSDMFGSRGWYTEKNGKFIPKKEMVDMLETWIQTARKAGCEYINESALSTEEYYESTKRFIDVQVDNNLAFRKQVTATPMPTTKYSDGDLSYLTNGVRGANDFKVHWLGWEAKDFQLILDLEENTNAQSIEISTLYDPKSWILHPRSITCYISKDGIQYQKLNKISTEGEQKDETVNKTFVYNVEDEAFRFVKFDIEGTKKLFDWHPSAGGGSWTFVDEIVVKKASK